ncbi:S1C family serine protease [Lachnoanaerobaculum sp. ICM7]|uniref:S1C family serine protease n=1 Tax=Lachnoanaerobaculum sp. ICM7 TaxID=936594 RepID=UPI000550A422
MGFDRDEFDNEINNAQEHTTNTENTTEISNTNTADEIGIDTQSEQKDIDSIIKRHTDSLAKAAENIAKNETESDSSANTVSLDKTNTNDEVNNNANIEGNSRETYRTTQSEDVRARALAAQPQKVQGKGKERKKSKVGKAVGLVASAAVFGLVAGGVMVGVNTVANSYIASNVETKDNIVIGNQTDIKSDSESTAAPATNLSNMDVSTIVDKAMPSVVAIYGKAEITQNSFFGTQSYEAQSSGSGIIVGKTDTELLVVTNNHVIADTDSLEVEFNDGTKATASVKGGDSDNDVAVVAIKLSDLSEDTLSKISIANIGDSNDIKVGQGVVAIGNALGYGQSVTVGYISALNREVKTEGGTSRNLLQTDAAINPGNSGGALLNMKGEVIGINSAKYSDTDVEGMGYAIPISAVKDLIAELSSKETRTVVAAENQGYLGIQGKDIDEEMAKAYDMPQGIYVYKVVEGGAAASSDLKAKDIITKFDGQSVRSMESLKNMLTYYESGKTVDLTVQRLDESGNYVEKTVTITLGKREATEQ